MVVERHLPTTTSSATSLQRKTNDWSVKKKQGDSYTNSRTKEQNKRYDVMWTPPRRGEEEGRETLLKH